MITLITFTHLSSNPSQSMAAKTARLAQHSSPAQVSHRVHVSHGGSWRAPGWLFILLAFAALSCTAGRVSSAEEATANEPSAEETAVALNYCRASFYRIQQTPTRSVLWEEREKILNNLNLNGIADPEVIRLYTSVLGEISDVQIAEKERVAIQESHRKAFLKSLSVSAFSLGTQLATQNYLAAVQTGARSWWDYRDTVVNRELDEWRLEKSRLTAVVDKSSMFLDTFWKLARKRSIPDAWLVRGHDLNRLAAAVRERDAEVRLRVLKRMERFMQCFPPYHYHLARTHQQLGQWTAAVECYQQVARLGRSSFRRDEMLAASYVNQALIEDYLKMASAPATARLALRQSSDAWEVNLAAGLVLMRHGAHGDAEDAILRNLDVDLEQSQSQLALSHVYRVSGQPRKLAALMTSMGNLAEWPADQLLLTAVALDSTSLPTVVTKTLTESLSARIDHAVGRNDLVIRTGKSWNLDRARLAVRWNGQLLTRPQVTVGRDGYEVRFRKIADRQNTAVGEPIPLIVQYPEVETFVVYLEELSDEKIAAVTQTDRSRLIEWRLFPQRSSLRLTAVDAVGHRAILPTARKSSLQQIPIAGRPRTPQIHRTARPPVPATPASRWSPTAGNVEFIEEPAEGENLESQADHRVRRLPLERPQTPRKSLLPAISTFRADVAPTRPDKSQPVIRESSELLPLVTPH